MNPQQAFALVLRQERLNRGLTQSDLASLAGVTSRYIRNLEAGRSSPTLDTLFGLACALDTKAHHIVANVEEKVDATDIRNSD
ncbi:helix-turn-helix domain-containing protein [Giesbergeria anulus]|uniref:DNA-binding transcriptional regulator, XRE-family HTH domain n=1 Tax=Giesbergeria anulus TaxID=180197 RepID=A0A1H9SPK4_9BURK|nr:helix-turn-helix transcriptional regulator [Giesbergeria anulus]SER86343.1 DNA-binding transcriptional regulator, XRE-family HTH domain [Giesbergeria anulus]